MKTYFRLDKDDFKVIKKALRFALSEEQFKYIDKESAEYLIEEISNKIIGCGTTRKNWQVVDYNDPSFSTCYDRTQYSHYGEF